MSEPKGEYKVNTWGGSRGGGRPNELKGGQYLKFYADAKTIQIIKAMVESKRTKNQSEAIRMAVKSLPLS
jgi:hypothetical protein